MAKDNSGRNDVLLFLAFIALLLLITVATRVLGGSVGVFR